MQKHGYDILQADQQLWYVIKSDDMVGKTTVPVTTAELNELLPIEKKKAFEKLLNEIYARPIYGR